MNPEFPENDGSAAGNTPSQPPVVPTPPTPEQAPQYAGYPAPAYDAPAGTPTYTATPSYSTAQWEGIGQAFNEPAAPAVIGKVRGRTVAWIAGLSLLVGGAGGAGATYLLKENNEARPVQLSESLYTESVSRPAGSVAQVAAAVLPSVVSLETTVNGARSSTGSGFVISEDGYIVTNAHVVADADKTVQVLFADGSIESGEIVGLTTDYDIAVVKVNRSGLVPLVLGDSDDLAVGDNVIAIGSPLGLASTVTTGIVSSLHRPVTAGDNPNSPAFIDAIQTDAAINPGNSGGPLLNERGEVIGINSAIAALPGATQTSGAGSVGLGFAIPSNQVRRTVEEIIETGSATYPVIGVVIDRRYTGEGVLVSDDETGVVAGGPGDKAGLQAGDVLTALDGRPMTRADEFIVAIRAKAPGDTVKLTVLRDGTEREIEVELVPNNSVTYLDTTESVPTPSPSPTQ